MTMKFGSQVRLISCLLLCSGLSLASIAEAGNLYKWIDDQGQIHYGDRIPPEYAKKERKTLNDQGIVVDTKARAKTPEEIAEAERLARLKAEEERRQAEQAAKDKILLDTFSNEDEMIMTRNGKIEAIDAVIRITKGRIEKLGERLTTLTARAAHLERSGRTVPDELDTEIRSTRQQIRENKAYIAQKGVEQQAIRDQFETDIQRFRELQAEIERKKREAMEKDADARAAAVR